MEGRYFVEGAQSNVVAAFRAVAAASGAEARSSFAGQRHEYGIREATALEGEQRRASRTLATQPPPSSGSPPYPGVGVASFGHTLQTINMAAQRHRGLERRKNYDNNHTVPPQAVCRKGCGEVSEPTAGTGYREQHRTLQGQAGRRSDPPPRRRADGCSPAQKRASAQTPHRRRSGGARRACPSPAR
jgi:hypothetical protein